MANSSSQDAFCAGSRCVFTRIYDQSPNQNHLGIGPPGGAHKEQDIPADASAGPLMIGGKKVYGIRMDPPSGYRNDTTTGIAVGDEAATTYAVLNGSHYNNRCCFDYGNAETDNLDDGAGTMEALYFGNANGGLNHGGAGKGPWIMADMENALWGADVVRLILRR
jgi:non-reducing end alpha-L-arabinofuranosidase